MFDAAGETCTCVDEKCDVGCLPARIFTYGASMRGARNERVRQRIEDALGWTVSEIF